MKKNIVILVTIIIVFLVVSMAYYLSKNNNSDYEKKITENENDIYITLYFPSIEKQFLIGEQRQITPKENLAQDIVEQLAIGPMSLKSKDIFLNGSPLKRAFVQENIVYLDFNKTFINVIKKSKWENHNIIIYSIVNSILDNISVKRVQLLVEGKKLLIEPGNYSYFNPLTKNNSIISHMEDLDITID